MYKFLGNYEIDFDIKLDELKFNSHKVYAHNDKFSEEAKSAGYGDNTEFMKVWGEDYPQYLRDYVEKFPIKVVNSNFQVQKPGNICAPHHDTFKMIRELGFDEKPYRILVCMSDWMFGQVIMIEDLVITNWKKGDAYIWDNEALHMSANGSIGDKLTMIISGFYEDN
tara:strand:+ start:1854 stop:2354 length:501 start_codon:yes stop_codon:yes gene_type:complete